MSCGCGGGAGGASGAGGAGDSGQPVDVRTTRFNPLLSGVGDSLNYTGKVPTLWVGADAQQADLADSVNNAAWWGQVLVVVAATAGVVWIVHKVFQKR